MQLKPFFNYFVLPKLEALLLLCPVQIDFSLRPFSACGFFSLIIKLVSSHLFIVASGLKRSDEELTLWFFLLVFRSKNVSEQLGS